MTGAIAIMTEKLALWILKRVWVSPSYNQKSSC